MAGDGTTGRRRRSRGAPYREVRTVTSPHLPRPSIDSPHVRATNPDDFGYESMCPLATGGPPQTGRRELADG